MYAKILFSIILILILAIIQTAFITGLPLGLNAFNLIAVVIVVILTLFGLNLALWWAIGLGFLTDLFFFTPFGVNMVILLAVLLLANFLLNNFFTNRSLYAFLALTFFSSLAYRALIIITDYLQSFFTSYQFSIVFNKEFWVKEITGLSANLGAILIIFYLFNFFSGRLKPVFLLRKRHILN